MYKINCDSDFKIIEEFEDGSSISSSPFKFTYYTRPNRNTWEASYIKGTYTNCAPTNDGKLIVSFDDHKLGTGQLKVRREFLLSDTSFNDGTCNLVSDETLNIQLEKNIKADCNEINSQLQTYYHIAGLENSEDFEHDSSGNFVISNKFKNSKQDTLISGENIYTINNKSLLDGNNIEVQEPLIPGETIKTINGESILGNGNIEIDTTIEEGSISLDKLSEDVVKNFRSYHLGEFSSATAAYDAAANYDIYSNKNINILTYTITNRNISQIIFQHHSVYSSYNDLICTQYMFYEGNTRGSYIRTFDVNSRQLMHGWEPIHLYSKYEVENNKVVGYTSPNDLNSSLHKKVELFSLPEQPSLANVVTTNTTQTITSQKQFNGNISISGKSLITSSIDPGEFKVFPQGSNTNKGFIIRTANRSESIPNIEILATNNQQSYKYEFPKKSGIIPTAVKINNTTHTPNLNDGIIDLGTYVTSEVMAQAISESIINVINGEA